MAAPYGFCRKIYLTVKNGRTQGPPLRVYREIYLAAGLPSLSERVAERSEVG